MVVYPNPAKDNITLDAGSNSILEENIIIIDMLGKTYNLPVLRKSENSLFEINLSSLNEGIYFIRIQNEAEFELIRIVKYD